MAFNTEILCQKGGLSFIFWIYEKSKDSSSMINLIELLFNQHLYESKLFITWDAA